MTEKCEGSTYDHHELNCNKIALGHLSMSINDRLHNWKNFKFASNKNLRTFLSKRF
ncbi:hypothetical protein Hanom_Chr02g00117731 [Helianthus anomalus]